MDAPRTIILDPLDASWTHARELVATGAPVYVGVNPVEYHGPHLSLHNDALVSRGLIEALHARLTREGTDWPLLVTPDLEVGVDPVQGPGTRTASYPAVRRAVLTACEALADLGAQKVVLMTFHGGPLHNLALEDGAELLAERNIPCFCGMHVMLSQWLDFDLDEIQPALAHISDPALRDLVVRWLPHDFHGGFIETAMALHYAPESVSPCLAEVPPCPPVTPSPAFEGAARALEGLGARKTAAELRFAAYGVGWMKMRPFPGYTGVPHLATPEVGAFVAERVVKRMAEAAERTFSGGPRPRPLMTWARTLSLGGRMPSSAVPATPIPL